MKKLNEIYKFMSQRYGADELHKFLFFLYIIGFIISIFIKNFFLDLSLLLIVIISVYRFISKNIERRSKENKIYLNIRNSIIGIFKPKKNKKDNDYIYKKCPKCKTILRLPLPSKRGIKHAKCPKCKKRLTIICLRKLKIEFIKKGDTE